MPVVVACALGAVGSVVAAKFLLREARRINAELAAIRAARIPESPQARPTLRRDAATGEYRLS